MSSTPLQTQASKPVNSPLPLKTGTVLAVVNIRVKVQSELCGKNESIKKALGI